MRTLVSFTPTYLADIAKPCHPFLEKGSRLTYGTSGLGGVWGKVEEEESIDCLLYAFEHHVTSIDTSPSYYKAESYVGKALRRWSGKRPFISTKVGRLPAERADECYVDYSPARMRDSLMRSLDQMGVERIDLLFLHEPQLVPLEKMEEIIETLQLFKAEGYTRLLGVGGNPTDAFRPYITLENFQVVSGFLKMNACNLSAFEKDIPHLQQQGIAYYAASALHMGLLGNRFESYSTRKPDSAWITHTDIKTAKAMQGIAQKYGMPLSSLAQRYLFAVQEANRVVVGAHTREQIAATLDDWRQGALPEPIFEEISRTIVTLRQNDIDA